MQKPNSYIIYVLLFLLNTTFAQFNTKTQLGISITANVGTQENLLNIALTGNSLLKYNDFTNEIGAGLGVDLSFTRYGVFTSHINFIWEGYILSGIKKNTPELFYSGTLNSANFNTNTPLNSFGAIGFGMLRSYTSGRLSPFNKKLGSLIVRSSFNDNRIGLIRMSNDFKGGPFLGGGTDQGETGALDVNYYYQDSSLENIQQWGLTLSLFTPVPDYGKNPDNLKNSDLSSRPVLYGKAPFENLFHGNLFLSYGYTSKHMQYRGHLGLDSKKLGAFTQNKLHDSFGLYPRFAWPKEEKDQIYFQLETSRIYVE